MVMSHVMHSGQTHRRPKQWHKQGVLGSGWDGACDGVKRGLRGSEGGTITSLRVHKKLRSCVFWFLDSSRGD